MGLYHRRCKKWRVDRQQTQFNSNGGNYSGATTMNLTISNVPVVFNNYKYRAVVKGPQADNIGYTHPITLGVTNSLKPFASND